MIMGDGSTMTLQRSSTDTNLKVSGLAKTSPRRLRAQSVTVESMSAPPKKRRSKGSAKASNDMIPEDESCLREEVPDMNWKLNKKEGGEGSTSTATTMDSSCGSLDSGGKRPTEKPDMDWGSHAKSQIGVVKKSNSSREMGSGGSGHAHGKKNRRDGMSKSDGHSLRKKGSFGSSSGRKSLSSKSLHLSGKGGPRKADLTKSPKKKLALMSPLMQIMAMDATFHSQIPEKGVTKAEEMFHIAKKNGGSDASSSEDEEEDEEAEDEDHSSDDDDDEEEHDHDYDDDEDGSEESQDDQPPKPTPRRQKATRSQSDGKRKSARPVRPNRSKTLGDVSQHKAGTPKRNSTRIRRNPDGPAPRKGRAQSMVVRSPGLDDSRRVRNRPRQHSVLPEDVGLITPRNQGRRSAGKHLDTNRNSSRQHAPPSALDLGYGDEIDEGDYEDPAATPQQPSNRQRRGRRASLGSGSVHQQSNHPSPQNIHEGSTQQQRQRMHVMEDHSSAHVGGEQQPSIRQRRVRRASVGAGSVSLGDNHQNETVQREGSRRGQRMIGHGDNTMLEGLVTPRRSARNLAVPSPFDPDEEEEEEDDGMMNHQSERSSRARLSHRPAQDPRRRRDISSRRASVSAGPILDDHDGEDDHEDDIATDHMMDVSNRMRRRTGSRRSMMETPRRPTRSLRGLDRLKGDQDGEGPEEDDTGSVGVRSVRSADAELGRGSVRERRLDAVDDALVGRRRNGSVSRGGRYGYGNHEDNPQRLCLSAVPSTPKKSVGLAALLYCKPLALGHDDDKDDDDDKSMNTVLEDTNDATENPEDVTTAEKPDEEEKQHVDKAKAKKDYWKAKLAAGK